MGALQGSISIRRYRVMDRPKGGFRDTFEKGVRAHALVPLDPKKNPHDEKSIGWCSLHDENDVDLTWDKFWLDGFVLLSLRVDVIKPPAAEVRRQLALRQRELEKQRKSPLSRGALRDLKEAIVADLRVKTPPKVKTTDMVWNLDEQRLYFFSQSKGQNETFTDLFAQTFSIPIDIEGPGAWASDLAADEELEELLGKAAPTPALPAGFAGLRPGTRPIDELTDLADLK